MLLCNPVGSGSGLRSYDESVPWPVVEEMDGGEVDDLRFGATERRVSDAKRADKELLV